MGNPKFDHWPPKSSSKAWLVGKPYFKPWGFESVYVKFDTGGPSLTLIHFQIISFSRHSGIWGFMTLDPPESKHVSNLRIRNRTENKN